MRTNMANRLMAPAIVLAASMLAAPSAGASPQMADIHTLSGAAKCNNGEPAVFYFLPGSVQNRSKYLIVLSGGGFCGSDVGCAERWIDETPGPGDGIIGWHGNMVPSSNVDMNFNDRGILDFDGDPAVNPFVGYSRIYVPYCSSDTWVGMGTTVAAYRWFDVDGDNIDDDVFDDVLGDSLTDVDADHVELYFGGARIIEAVIAEVIQGYNNDPGTIPTEIVLVGSSAGGAGVNANLDLVAEQVQAATNGAENALVWGISDSSNEIGIFVNNAPSQLIADSVWDRFEYYSNGQNNDVAHNQTCVDEDPGIMECWYAPYVLANYMQTPIFLTGNAHDKVDHKFVYQDLTCFDNALSSTFVNGCYTDTQASDWIRDHISNIGAPQLASGQYAGASGYYIANFDHQYHELTKRNATFFGSANTEAAMNVIDPDFGDGPRLSGNANDPRSLATTLACFREKVIYAPSAVQCSFEVRSSIIP